MSDEVTIDPGVRAAHVAFLEAHADEWMLSEIEAGEDDELANAFTEVGKTGLETPVLRLERLHDRIRVRLQYLAFLAAPGCPSNAATLALLRRLYFEDDDHAERDNIDIIRLHAQGFTQGHRSFDELMGNVILASNDCTVFTRAVRDPHDGEIYVDSTLPSDFVEVEPELEDVVGAVLGHGARIERFMDYIRAIAAPTAQHIFPVHLQASLGRSKKDDRNGKEEEEPDEPTADAESDEATDDIVL